LQNKEPGPRTLLAFNKGILVAEQGRKKRVRKPLQQRAEATVTFILEAAAHIFRTHGLRGATTNRIAERAGVSIGSLYQYFPNKEALLVALMERHIAETMRALGETLATTGNATPRDRVAGLVRCLLDIHMEDPELHRILFEEAPRPPHMRDAFDKGEREMRVVLTELFEGFSRDICTNPERSAQIVPMLAESMVHRYVSAKDPVMTPDTFSDHLTEIVMREMALSSPLSADCAR